MKLVQFPLQRPRSPPVSQLCSPLCSQALDKTVLSPALFLTSHSLHIHSCPASVSNTPPPGTPQVPKAVLGSILFGGFLLLFETCPCLGSVTRCHVLFSYSWQALPPLALHVKLPFSPFGSFFYDSIQMQGHTQEDTVLKAQLKTLPTSDSP